MRRRGEGSPAQYIIGVDAGGTCTKASAYGLDGSRISGYETGSGNVTADGWRAEENIAKAVRGCIYGAQGECLYIAIGMAGLDEGATPARIRGRLREFCLAETDVLTDGVLALYTAHRGGDGLLVISGTGSIAYGKRRGEMIRRGGWGHILGDAGSGYAIAAEAIRLALADLDDGLPECDLTLALKQALGCERLRGLVEHVYGRPKGETAALAQVVAERCERGDTRAASILGRAGGDLAALALELNARLGLPAPCIALAGGIATHMSAVRNAFETSIAAELPGAAVAECGTEPQKGAIYLYRERKGVDGNAD